MTAATCCCDGRYEGCGHGRRCGASVTDDRWGPWCGDCNPRRFAHIDAQFTVITDRFGGSGEGGVT